MNLAIIDIIFIVLIVLFMIRCYLRGFITEVLSMAAVVLGLITALYFYKNGGEFISESFMPDHKAFSQVVSFILLFLIVFILVKLIESLILSIIEGIQLGGADRVLGFIFGFAEGLVVVCLVLFVLVIQPLFNPEAILSDSFFASTLLPLITEVEIAGGV